MFALLFIIRDSVFLLDLQDFLRDSVLLDFILDSVDLLY